MRPVSNGKFQAPAHDSSLNTMQDPEPGRWKWANKTDQSEQAIDSIRANNPPGFVDHNCRLRRQAATQSGLPEGAPGQPPCITQSAKRQKTSCPVLYCAVNQIAKRRF